MRSVLAEAGDTRTAYRGGSVAQLVALAFDTPPTGENIVFTITYRRGHGDKPEGSLVEGETVKIKKGMIFNVTATDKS